MYREMKKYLFYFVLTTVFYPTVLLSIQVEIPDWHNTVNSYFKLLGSTSELLSEEATWYTVWLTHVNNLDSIRSRVDSMRRQVYACIPNGFTVIDTEILQCSNNKEQKDVLIISLLNMISTLEQSIATLNISISDIHNQINSIKLATATILDIQEDKVEELESALQSMLQAQQTFEEEREYLKKQLEELKRKRKSA